MPGLIARLGLFDLDHPRAQIAQQQGAEGASDGAGQVENPQTLQRAAATPSLEHVCSNTSGKAARDQSSNRIFLITFCYIR
jgi:hypothetical protein